MIQSGLDKALDWKGNHTFLSGHFSDTFLSSFTPLMLATVLVLELVGGLFCLLGVIDGLLSYDVGLHNWPILSRAVSRSIDIPDSETREAMKWLYDKHGLRTEPSGAIATAALLAGNAKLEGEGDIVVVISGRNVDEAIRILDALQFHEMHGEVCPANWKPGEDGMKDTHDGVADYLSKH